MPAKRRLLPRFAESTALPELLLGLLGILLVVSFLVILVMQWVTTRTEFAHLRVRASEVIEFQGMHEVEIVVENTGGETAAAALATGTLERGDATVEEASVTISYVPAGSEAKAVLVFRNDPNEYELKLMVRGYEKP